MKRESLDDILEALSQSRNLDPWIQPMAEPLAEPLRETMDFAEYMAEPGLEERAREAEFIICQLKDYYRTRGLEVYEREGENSLLLRDRRSTCLVQTRTDAQFCMITLKVLMPVIAAEEHMEKIACCLHSFNEDPEAGFGFFHLDDITGQVSIFYRYSFAGGDFTEEGFHRYYRSAVKTAEGYRRTIEQLMK